MSGKEAAEALEHVADAFRRDLAGLFGHGDVQVASSPTEVVATGTAGRVRVTWPFALETEGRLGDDGRVTLELLMASETPHDLWSGYRPPSPERRRAFFDAMHGYLDEVFADNEFFQPLLVEERGPALLVYHDGDWAIVSDNGDHRGEGILHWKVKRLVAYALTDVL